MSDDERAERLKEVRDQIAEFIVEYGVDSQLFADTDCAACGELAYLADECASCGFVDGGLDAMALGLETASWPLAPYICGVAS